MSAGFASAAFVDISDPDWAHVCLDVLPAHADADPAAWARTLFSVEALPAPLRIPLQASHAMRRGSGPPPWCERFRVRSVVGDEALVGLDVRAFDLRVAVGVDESHALVRVVTTMRCKGGPAVTWAARAGVALLLRRMLARARASMSGLTR